MKTGKNHKVVYVYIKQQNCEDSKIKLESSSKYSPVNRVFSGLADHY